MGCTNNALAFFCHIIKNVLKVLFRVWGREHQLEGGIPPPLPLCINPCLGGISFSSSGRSWLPGQHPLISTKILDFHSSMDLELCMHTMYILAAGV